MQQRVPRLRSILSTITILVCAFALLASIGLIALSTALHHTVDRLGEAAESIHLVEEAQLGLVVHPRALNTLARREIERSIRQRLTGAQRSVSNEAEGRALQRARTYFEDYVSAVHAGADTEQVGRRLEVTYTALETLVGINVAQAREARDRAAHWDRLATALGGSMTVLLLSLTAWLVFWLRKRAFQPLFDLAGTIQRFTQGDREVRLPEAGPEELRVIVRRFNELAAALAEQRKAQMAFLAGVAHDLRNPLSAMSLSIAAMPEGRPLPPEPRIRRAFEMLGRQLTRIERMLGDFMDMAKIEAGELRLDIQASDARTLVEATVRMFESTAPKHRIETELPEGPLPLRCDALRIEQVLSNLVSNAIKYSPSGGAVVVAVHAQGDQLVFEVRDNGLGIPEEALPTLFEPFRRGDHGGDGIPGAGLGLFVVRRIVDAHGGSIEVSSVPRGGSTFRVTLPASVRVEAVDQPRAAGPFGQRYGTHSS